jgi:uroporphyrinogen decarboxylase
MRVESERGRQTATLRARAIREGIHPRAILTGEDQCSQRGPMVSPAVLHREYFPLLEYVLEPLLAVGARVVWHCDGDVRPVLPDVLACGIAGLQGFQRECGMDLEWIVNLHSRRGEPLLIFGPLSVTGTLPFGTPDDVRAEVRRAMELCREKASLVFFSSNTINPDIPFDNVLAFWDAVVRSRW